MVVWPVSNWAGSPPRRRGGRQKGEVVRVARLAHPRVGGADATLMAAISCGSGSPPRRRGGRWRCPSSEGGCRLTPASAGRTVAVSVIGGWLPAHPRVGGADLRPWHFKGPLCGSPPPRRGGPGDIGALRATVRLTPASAGRTAWRFDALCVSAAHPRVGGTDAVSARDTSSAASSLRVGGADLTWYIVWPLGCGSPPRRRGGHHAHLLLPHGTRLTPASAGRTRSPTASAACTSAHPRVGGADVWSGVSSGCPVGSPPRRRGGRPMTRGVPAVERLTPASAGRTG